MGHLGQVGEASVAEVTCVVVDRESLFHCLSSHHVSQHKASTVGGEGG